MHESGRAEAVFRTLQAELAKHDCQRVVKVTLVVGELSGADADHIIEHLREYAQGTPLEGAAYEVVEKPVEFACAECGARYGADTEKPGCPQCGGLRHAIVGGHEFAVEAMEIE
ncbi:MAG TPA: hydrogenase maturation nickel metallochaperone HypA [Planctomycetota bacterium]|nr:hydrogenase maturation nickel metallochaperone HypA [Planctomycetota bacterium]HRR82365.1 hydrogenase maturation nickel metallochaperone HypA [Planctomycetota bacterium]HRT95599.1 hydrogenase maturation nickel metallochaperone HypA [Planctomycetota bacterium]